MTCMEVKNFHVYATSNMNYEYLRNLFLNLYVVKHFVALSKVWALANM